MGGILPPEYVQILNTVRLPFPPQWSKSLASVSWLVLVVGGLPGVLHV